MKHKIDVSYIILLFITKFLDGVVLKPSENDIKQAFHFNCFTRQDGVYADVASRCKIYHICYRGRRYSFKCKRFEVFDEGAGQCMKSAHSCTSFIRNDKRCVDKENSFYPDLSFTTTYFQCHEKNAIEYICPIGQEYDANAQACTYISLEDPDQLNCKDLPDGYYHDNQTRCKDYYICSRGKKKKYSCPADYRLDFDTLRCKNGGGSCPSLVHRCRDNRSAIKVECGENCKHFYVCSNNTDVFVGRCQQGMILNGNGTCVLRRLGNTIACQDKKDGYYSEADVTHIHYYECKSGILASNKSCRNEEAFDRIKSTCNGKSTKILCEGRENSMYPDYSQDCQRYFICEGNLSTIAYCPDGYKFNSQIMVCDLEENVECKKASRRNQIVAQSSSFQETTYSSKRPQEIRNAFSCPSQEAGFFADYLSGCQNFHICYNDKKMTYTCPIGLLFNPSSKSCDLPENVYCIAPTISSAKKYNCGGRNGGYFLDQESNCTRYYTCKDDFAVIFNCPPNKLYNERTMACDLAGTFNCYPSSGYDEVRRHSFSCADRGDGYYPDYTKDCHVFYRCRGGRKYTHYCKRGFLFNPHNNFCDFQKNVVCRPPTVTVQE